MRGATTSQTSTIEDVRFSIDPWQLDVSSNFQVDFRLSFDVTRIRLDLRPSRTIVNHAAEVIYLGPEGRDDSFDSLMDSALLSDGDALLFKGDALLFDYKRRTWRKAGRGRIVIRRPRPYLFEGIFSLDGDRYHVILSSNYRKIRYSGDSSPPLLGSTHMVVWNQADVN